MGGRRWGRCAVIGCRDPCGRDRATSRDRPSIVFLFQKDLMPSRVEGMIHMMRGASRYVENLGPHDRAAVVVYEHRLYVWQDFTSDRDRLHLRERSTAGWSAARIVLATGRRSTAESLGGSGTRSGTPHAPVPRRARSRRARRGRHRGRSERRSESAGSIRVDCGAEPTVRPVISPRTRRTSPRAPRVDADAGSSARARRAELTHRRQRALARGRRRDRKLVSRPGSPACVRVASP